MKRIIYLIISVTFFKTTNAGPLFNASQEPRASFDKMWVDYDVTEDSQKGMRLHLKFTTYDMKDMDAYVAVYFKENDINGPSLKDKNDKFVSTAGDVALYKSIKPSYNPAVFDDLQLFMPYNELDLDPGTYNLTMDVKLIYKTGGTLQKLTTYDFEYTKPGAKTNTNNAGGAPAALASASYKDLWIDYDVTENGKKGMRIHVKFSLSNMKGVDSYLAVYFEKKNGEKLKGLTSAYRSSNGQAAVYRSLKPGYDDADYDDMDLFMPYSELNLGKGKFDLNMIVSIIYKNGDLLKDLTTHQFWFSQ